MKGCGKDDSLGLIPHICGKTIYYNRPSDEKGHIYYCKKCSQTKAKESQ